ncbi:MAG TPA: hypothetical protein PLT36_04885 [Erysipelotrichaceae bacterium]|nr:hypothetical protein [Erysipelotrichia bacterium]HPX32820.1 hypothetical protein [Erysipelotrichaceae bacterium]HQA85449.1 hypothetical protein [Erysipelotrichaceae bacterium]
MEKYVNCLINLKLASIKRNELDNLTFNQLQKVLYNTKWRLYIPDSLSVIASDIESLTVEEIVDYLTSSDDLLEKSVEEFKKELEVLGYEKE